MLVLVFTMVMMFLMVSKTDGDVNINLLPAMLVDLFGWYIIGVYLGVLPALT